MKNIKEILNKIIKTAFEKSGFENKGLVVNSEREDLCDFQCNDCMQLAKIAHKSPMEIAKEVVSNVEKNEVIKTIEIAPAGFINITINNNFLTKHTDDLLKNFKQNIAEKHTPKKIVIDYGGANIAKPLHIGHLRSAIIGESLKRIANFIGDEVIGDVHLGDWGLQMGMVIAEIKRRQPDLVYFDKNFSGEYPKTSPVTIEDLETLYPEASKRAKSDETAMEEARKATYELQNNNKGYIELWKQFCKVSIEAAKNNYDNLDVNFELWNGESSSNYLIKPMIDNLVEKGFAYESNGALVVNVSEPDDKVEIPPFLLIKSDGAALYSTTDLATIIDRQNKLNPDEIWYVVDNRQSLHFTQLFRCAEKTKIKNINTKLEFVGFGTMNGKDGKPYKTREGGTMKLCDLIDEIQLEAKKKIEQNLKDRTDLKIDEIDEIKNCVALATLKFADLSNYRAKDYVFDINKFMEFEGKTGPYLLYTVARLNSLLNKNKINEKTESFNIYSDIEKKILLTITTVEDSILKAYQDKAPSYLCDTAFKLANYYNTFYSSTNLMKEQDINKKSSWIKLSTLTLQTLKVILNILGIKTVEKM